MFNIIFAAAGAPWYTNPSHYVTLCVFLFFVRFPAGQSAQLVASVAAETWENLPAEQPVQAAGPAVEEYWPGWHSQQGPGLISLM